MIRSYHTITRSSIDLLRSRLGSTPSMELRPHGKLGFSGRTLDLIAPVLQPAQHLPHLVVQLSRTLLVSIPGLVDAPSEIGDHPRIRRIAKRPSRMCQFVTEDLGVALRPVQPVEPSEALPSGIRRYRCLIDD